MTSGGGGGETEWLGWGLFETTAKNHEGKGKYQVQVTNLTIPKLPALTNHN